jgi:sensor histidine kinase YesM
VISNSIGLIGASFIVFLRYWQHSDKRIHELENTGVRTELEKARTKVDSAALIDTLNQAASIAVSMPGDASDMLIKLGKSLRVQLYESSQKQDFSTNPEKTSHTFGDSHRLLNFIVDNRFRLARNILLALAAVILGSAYNSSFVGIVGFSVTFMLLTYFNIYFLLPRLFFKGKTIGYMVVIVLFITFFMTVHIAVLPSPDFFPEKLSGFFWLLVIPSIIMNGFVFAGTAVIVIFRRWVRNERRISQLETAAMRAELEQLQNQINPHFLFNMLNNILTLIRETPEEAVVYLRKMSDMLKYQFGAGAKNEVLLSDDIQFLTDFLNLEKIRRDSFEFVVTIDKDAENRRVPPLLFIPFVENAVKHGADAVNHSYIHLNFELAADMLHFTCLNSKPPAPEGKSEYGGLGLVNIRRRLELLFGDDYSLNILEAEKIYIVNLNF